MDFFEYASIYSTMASMFGASVVAWVQFLIGGLCFAIVFIFQAIALFVIASREGYKNKWMAFVPFLNTYYIGVCAQKNKFYNIDTKKIGIAAAVLEAALFSLYVLYFVACAKVIDYETFTVRETVTGAKYREYYLENVPVELNWAAWMYNYMDRYILSTLSIIYLLLEVSLLICFFQTYASRRYVIFTLASVLFPIQGILFFVVRNNRGVNYRDFVRGEQARQYRMYQQYQQTVNQNPYNRNPYDGPSGYKDPYDGRSGDTGVKPEDPFGDLGGSGNGGGSPFDDFND